MANALEMIDVCKSFGGSPVVREFNLCLEFGQVLCLLGPSGAGKSTILEMAAGLLQPDSGQVVARRGHMAYTFQDDALVPWLSAEDNLKLVLEPRMERREAAQRTAHWLERLGLAEAARKKPSELSGGMRRRLGIARSFAVRPGLLLMDEPFAFLDIAWQKSLAGMIQDAAQDSGAAILLVSHQLEPLQCLDCPIVEFGCRGAGGRCGARDRCAVATGLAC